MGLCWGSRGQPVGSGLRGRAGVCEEPQPAQDPDAGLRLSWRQAQGSPDRLPVERRQEQPGREGASPPCPRRCRGNGHSRLTWDGNSPWSAELRCMTQTGTCWWQVP